MLKTNVSPDLSRYLYTQIRKKKIRVNSEAALVERTKALV